jgi:hypothetical protein
MAPRARKTKAENGLITFSLGTTEEHIQEFLKKNAIERLPNSPKYMTTSENITISVPPTKGETHYIIPDDVYAWFVSGS